MPRLLLAAAASAVLGAAASLSPAQDSSSPRAEQQSARPVPFGVGERMRYEVRFGALKVGEGNMEVLDISTVRGEEAWHTRFRVRGGVPFYRVNDVLESWIHVTDFHSLRFVQDLEEGGKSRERRFEIFPERAAYSENGEPEQPSVTEPLDDGSFLYFVRTIPLEVGATYEFNRYFRPDRNPVVVRVLRRERITVPAGTYNTIVIQPVIKTKGIFSEKGQARIWLSDDDSRIMVQMKSQLSFGSLNLFLLSHRPPTTTTETPAR